MPRIPEFRSSGSNLPRPSEQGFLSPSQEGSVGREVQRLGATISEAGRRSEIAQQNINAARRKAALAKATATAQAQTEELVQEFQSRTDVDVFEQEFAERSQQIQTDNTEGFDDNLREEFRNRLILPTSRNALTIRNLVRDRGISEGIANLDTTTLLNIKLSANTDEDIIRETFLNQREAIEDGVKGGLISPQEGVRRITEFIDRVEENRVQQSLFDDPEQTLVDLESGKFSNLKESRRISLTRQAKTQSEALQRQRVIDFERAEREDDERRKERQENNDRAFTARIFGEGDEGPIPTLQELTQARARGDLTSAQFKTQKAALLASQSGEAIISDPQAMVELQDGVLENRVKNTEILKAFSNGLIDQDDALNLLKQADSVTRRGGILDQEDVKFELDRISDTVGGIKGPLAILDSNASKRVSNAQVEARDRIVDGENPREVANDIIQRFAPNIKKSFSVLPKPRFMVGETKATMNINETARKTVEAFNNGQITEAIFDSEAQLIKDLESLIERQKDILNENARSN